MAIMWAEKLLWEFYARERYCSDNNVWIRRRKTREAEEKVKGRRIGLIYFILFILFILPHHLRLSQWFPNFLEDFSHLQIEINNVMTARI